MGFTTSDTDSPVTLVNSSLPYNVYLYWMDSYYGGLDSGVISMDTVPLSHASTLISAQYCPYLNADDFNITKIPYDKQRYGYNVETAVNVYRIDKFNGDNYNGTIEKVLGNFKCYQPVKNIGGARDWRNESKLYNYPFTKGYLYDGLCEPIEVKFEHCNSNISTVKTRCALNINADYSIFIEGYHNDIKGQMEQNVVTSSRDYPCSSSQYASWLATNKNQIQATVKNSGISATQSIITGIIGGAVTGATGGGLVGSVLPVFGNGIGAIGGGFLGAIGGGASALGSLMKQQNNLQAQEQDMRNVPPTLISRGSDLTMGINTTYKKLKLYTYRQKDEIMNKIGDFFAMYGYKQNKIMSVNLRSRKYYNYIKTVGVNIISTTIPQNDLQELKNIFDSGVTIWHIENGKYKDYSLDNMEV